MTFAVRVALPVMVATALSLSMTPALSKERQERSGVVTACSARGHFTCVSARYASRGRITLSGGTTIDCGPDCRETLRKETVDFWDTQRENGG